MAIYTRNEQGNFVPLNIPSLKGDSGKKGDKGEQGLPGNDGITPNIQIGTVTTLESDQQATVTKRGTKENPVFDFGIPKGPNGNDGKDGQSSIQKDTLVTTPIIDATLTLTADKYQTTTMKDNTTVVLPNVDECTEICLLFNTTNELTITFPKIRWRKHPSIRKDKINKFIFTYINGEWLGEHVSFYNSTMMPIMDGLVCWLDGFDLPVAVNNGLADGTVWRNKVEDGEDAIIKAISGNEIVDGVENGYFRTSGNGYVILPSFEGNSSYGLSAFVDAKINERPTTAFDRIFVLGYGITPGDTLAAMYGAGEFGRIRCFDSFLNGSLLGNINSTIFPKTIKIGVTTEKAKNFSDDLTLAYSSNKQYNRILNNNYLNAEHPKLLNTGDISYGLVLIYNRELTEEEMLHNYMYSLSIQRGE